jgi:hypothetical protein
MWLPLGLAHQESIVLFDELPSSQRHGILVFVRWTSELATP